MRVGVSVGVAEAAGVVEEEDFEGARRGGSLDGARELFSKRGSGAVRSTHGRKLQDEEGRLDTSVNISDIKRCCTAVS